MDTWSLLKARPISCKDCPSFQRLHMSFRCITESSTRFRYVINTTFREKIYSRWCCIDRLSRHYLQVKFLLDSVEATLKYWKEWQARADSLALGLRPRRGPHAFVK